MEDQGQQDEREGLPPFALQNAGDSDHDERGGDVARVKMLVSDAEGSAGDREGEQAGKHGHGGPLRGGFGKELNSDPAGSPEDGKEADKLPEELGAGERDMGDADELGHPVVKDG